jgi:hypothetical protein
MGPGTPGPPSSAVAAFERDLHAEVAQQVYELKEVWGRTFTEIAEETGYSRAQCHRMYWQVRGTVSASDPIGVHRARILGRYERALEAIEPWIYDPDAALADGLPYPVSKNPWASFLAILRDMRRLLGLDGMYEAADVNVNVEQMTDRSDLGWLKDMEVNQRTREAVGDCVSPAGCIHLVDLDGATG